MMIFNKEDYFGSLIKCIAKSMNDFEFEMDRCRKEIKQLEKEFEKERDALKHKEMADEKIELRDEISINRNRIDYLYEFLFESNMINEFIELNHHRAEQAVWWIINHKALNKQKENE